VAEAEGEVAAPEKTKEQLEAEQEQQLAALRVLYAAQHAVKHGNESCGTAPCGIDPKPKFDEFMANITFPKAEERKKARDEKHTKFIVYTETLDATLLQLSDFTCRSPLLER
jgi:hypothetical protein